MSQIFSAQKKEGNFYATNCLQLATISNDNKPRVRTVVFRGWSDSYEIEIFTDKRSQKYHELESNNNVEICWLFSRAKCQFRLSGKSRFCVGNDSLLHWKKLNDNSKLMYSWPHPGDNFIFDNEEYINSKDNLIMNDNFSLLKIKINHVDQLILHEPIHIRRRWIRSNEWIEERINP